jgi:hypothetical protein
MISEEELFAALYATQPTDKSADDCRQQFTAWFGQMEVITSTLLIHDSWLEWLAEHDYCLCDPDGCCEICSCCPGHCQCGEEEDTSPPAFSLN